MKFLHFWKEKNKETTLAVTKKIRSFYEETPFPNYDDYDSIGSLIDKSRMSVFPKWLDEQIPFGTLIIEAGCGTGQLTNFLSVASRRVIGTDICYNSLKMAKMFKDKNLLKRSEFVQMDLFNPCFKPNSFDLVISSGVLHHTGNPEIGFSSICKLVKPNGYILIGLYHKYGRMVTDIRRFIFNLTKGRLKFIDPRLISKTSSKAKKEAWYKDQYENPHETKHTITDVIKWFKRNGVTFFHSIPKTTLEPLKTSEQIFSKDRFGNCLERFIVGIGMVFRGYKEGGFFITIGRKVNNEKDT